MELLKAYGKSGIHRILFLQARGAENINLVTPTPQVPLICRALEMAKQRGLKLPVVYNCGGYESCEVIGLLEGFIDIYMPDFKYGSDRNGKEYSQVEHYFEKASEALVKMHTQVGDLKVNSRGAAQKGLLIRHLVLPGDCSGSKSVLDFIAHTLSIDSYVNIMDQYRPCYRAYEKPKLNRRFVRSEYEETIQYARRLGLYRGF